VSGASSTCLILGARGFVGSALVAEAERRGYRTWPVDVDEYAAARGTVCDLLINANGNSKKYLAAQDPAGEFDLSVRSVAHALQDFRYRRYVHLSTVDVYPEHADPARNAEDAVIDTARLSPYGLHKLLAEQLVRYYARDWLVLRLAGLVGRGLRKNSVYDLLKGRPLRVHPDSAYQYLHTRDLARLVFELAESAGSAETWNVAGDGLITLREVAALIPGCVPTTAVADAPLERYAINISKLKAWQPVPATVETVRQFVRAVLAGEEVLA